MSKTRSLLRTATAGALLGACVYAGADVAGEYSTYAALRDHGLKLAEEDEALKLQIGYPYVDGPWYNASIGVSQSGHVVSVTFPLKGDRQITDVTVRAVRRPGYYNLAAYNMIGPAEWKVMECTSMAPAPGGKVLPRSLVKPPPMPKVVDGKVVPGEECEECNRNGTAGPGPGAAVMKAGAPAGPSSSDGQTEPKKRRFWLF